MGVLPDEGPKGGLHRERVHLRHVIGQEDVLHERRVSLGVVLAALLAGLLLEGWWNAVKCS